MAKNPKIKRQWIKEEKQIVSLLYQKGLLEDFKITELYWAEYNWVNRKFYKCKPYGVVRRFPLYMPEIHYCVSDYWGEYDEYSVVSTIRDHLYWENADTENWDETSGDFPKSTFNTRMTRKQFIKYLESLPTKVSDKKINKIIRRQSHLEY